MEMQIANGLESSILGSVACLLARWRPTWEMWSACRELADEELDGRDPKRVMLDASLRRLAACARGLKPAIPEGELPMLVASFTWSQVQHLVAWAECGYDEAEAALRLGVRPASVAGALEHARGQLAGR